MIKNCNKNKGVNWKRIIWIICLLFIFPDLSFSQEIPLREKFLKEAPVMWREYLKHFTQIEGTFVQNLYRSANADRREITKGNFICDYPNVMFESESDDFSFHYCSNESYSFSLNMKDKTIIEDCSPLYKGDVPSIQNWSFPANERNVKRNSATNFIIEIVADGLLLGHKWLPTLIDCPNFTIEEIEEVLQNDELLVRIKFSNNPKTLDDQAYLMNVRHGEIFLYPDKYWLIKNGNCFFWSEDDSYTVQWTNNYDFEKFIAPQLISRNLVTTYVNDQSKTFIDFNFEFRPLQQVDPSRFTLTYYGLPEPDFGDRRPNRIRYIIMGVGLLMIGIGAWRMIQKRRENA